MQYLDLAFLASNIVLHRSQVLFIAIVYNVFGGVARCLTPSECLA